MNEFPQSARHSPLNRTASFVLRLGAAATILLCYAFAFAVILVLTLFVLVEIVIALGLARFGMSKLIAPVIGEHVALMGIIFRGFWLPKSADYRIPIPKADAHGFHTLLENLCHRARTAVPDEVSVEMSANAWVRMKGHRRGRGKTILAVGYDLLAGLSKTELEAILAHEISHARLVQRGISRLLKFGLVRISRLAAGLNQHRQSLKAAKKTSTSANILFSVIHRLAHLASRQVAAYSRQDEFTADAGAAELCGTEAIRSALVNAIQLPDISARLSWSERVSQLQSGEGFSRWLTDELSLRKENPSPELWDSLPDPYSTHPTLRDRIDALPMCEAPALPDNAPSMELFSDPEKIAETLVAEIQRLNAEQEQKDSKLLARWTRKTRSARDITAVQGLGFILILVGIFGGIGFWSGEASLFSLAIFVTIFVALGVVLIKVGYYREGVDLPVPTYAALKAAWRRKEEVKDERVAELQAELKALAGKEKSSHRKVSTLVSESCTALGQCDYLRAHVAANLALGVNNKSPEGALAFIVACAAFGQGAQMDQAFRFLQRKTGIRGNSTMWGCGWACFLAANWAQAEAFLELAAKKRDAIPTFHALIAICKSNRGKLESAILSAKRAYSLDPQDIELRKLVVEFLLQAGYLREAKEHLSQLQTECLIDKELMLSMFKLSLLSHQFPAAHEWAQSVRKMSIGGSYLVRLGVLYVNARRSEEATALFKDALSTGFYPEAHVGLAQLAADRRDKEEARYHLKSALSLGKKPGEDGRSTVSLFHEIIRQMVYLEDPIAHCRAWIASINKSPAAVIPVNTSFLVYGVTKEDAESALQTILLAMTANSAESATATVSWSDATREQQPSGLVRPGVQCVLS